MYFWSRFMKFRSEMVMVITQGTRLVELLIFLIFLGHKQSNDPNNFTYLGLHIILVLC